MKLRPQILVAMLVLGGLGGGGMATGQEAVVSAAVAGVVALGMRLLEGEE
jgi:hypothetical protein